MTYPPNPGLDPYRLADELYEANRLLIDALVRCELACQQDQLVCERRDTQQEAQVAPA